MKGSLEPCRGFTFSVCVRVIYTSLKPSWNSNEARPQLCCLVPTSSSVLCVCKQILVNRLDVLCGAVEDLVQTHETALFHFCKMYEQREIFVKC